MAKSVGVSLDPEHFLITMGASEALIFLFMLCCDPGDEVIVFDPTYANYLGFAAIAGVTLTPVLSDFESGFALPSYEEIARHVNGRTRAVLLCNPNNPTGTVYTDEEVRRLLDLCNDHCIFLVVDETYREFSYLDTPSRSVFHLDCHHERVIVVDSISKRFSLCGARIGCLITKNQELMHAALALASARLSAPTLGQEATAYMLDSIDYREVEKSIAEYRHRRDVLWTLMQEIEGVESYKPSGAFYALARLPVDDAENFCRFLLRDFSHKGATTFVAPAAGFFLDPERGRQQVRIAYVLNESELRDALAVFEVGLHEYQSRATPSPRE